ncbi:hypothetical protein [Mycobacteroides abscessus]|uniref:hypothetical protein n=1 Tax=Mycobacteroides abscessus TaxID=36809 RepID=UPI0012FFD856|nr:hypothetical protein [Mycobacteroides abscessus]
MRHTVLVFVWAAGEQGMGRRFAVRTTPPSDGDTAELHRQDVEPHPVLCMEVGAQDAGLASKAVGCFVLVHQAVLLFLRLVLAQEVSNDHVDV